MNAKSISTASIVGDDGEPLHARRNPTRRSRTWIYALLFVTLAALFGTANAAYAHFPALTLTPSPTPLATLTAAEYNNRGVASRALGDFEAALADFDSAIALDPHDAGAYNNRGITYYLMGEDDLSLENFNRAIELEPTYAMAYNNRGELYYRRFHDSERALADFDNALSLDPQNALAYNNRGNLYSDADHQQYEDAIRDYTRGIELQPDYYEAYTNRANAYYRMGDLERGYVDASQSIKLNPAFARAYGVRGAIEMTRGNNAAALEDFRAFIRLASVDENPDTINRVHELIRQLEAEVEGQ